MTDLTKPFQLLPIFRERPWGQTDLTPYFQSEATNGKQKIGEAWFSSDENPTSLGQSLGELLKAHPEILGTAKVPQHPGLPLLAKLLFTTERLSVQVHPNDDYAKRHHNSLGKTEAWYVLASEPPGEIAAGFRENITPQRLTESAQSGEIEGLLDWQKVEEGEVIFVPAGTVHAIGAGLVICEIQENSDITYRLYDYGRPRDLHLEHGSAVSNLGRHTGSPKTRHLAPWRDHLLQNEYFHMERLRPTASIEFEEKLPHYLLLVCTKGHGTIAGEPFAIGQAWIIPAGANHLEIDGEGSEWIMSYTASEELNGLSEVSLK